VRSATKFFELRGIVVWIEQRAVIGRSSCNKSLEGGKKRSKAEDGMQRNIKISDPIGLIMSLAKAKSNESVNLGLIS
jgi:hypothetical protein